MILPLVVIQFKIIILTEESKDKYHMILLIVVIQFKNDTNEFIYKTEIDSQTQKTNLITKGEISGGINE